MHLTVYVFPADQTGKGSDSFVPGTDCPYPWKVSGTWEQCGTNAIIIIVDIVAIIVDRAIVVDIRGVVTIVAGRPQPPSAHGLSIHRIPGPKPVTAVISFCHYSSMPSAYSGSPPIAGRSAHIALAGYIPAPLTKVRNNPALSDLSLRNAVIPYVFLPHADLPF